MISVHWHTLLLAARRFLRTPLSNLLTVLVIGVALSLPAGLYAVIDNLNRLADGTTGEPQITLFLQANASKGDIGDLADRLRKLPGVGQADFVGKDSALKELVKSAGIEDLAATLDHNPLPDAFIVRPSSDKPAELEALRSELEKLPKVDSAQLDSAWAKRFYALLQVGRQGVTVLAVLLALALTAIIGNTIRLQILTLRDEIEVSTLIGATDAFIRRPFLYFGALQGLLGGIVAWLVVAASLLLLNSAVADLAQQYGTAFRLQVPGPGGSLALLGGAALLGWLGAYVAVGRHLKHPGRHG
ncbi:MAG: permease-like cell division protein FtsX [Sulfuricellaceae bacterium]|jgi:cell division transport system permease protein